MNKTTANLLKLAGLFTLIVAILIAIFFLQPNSQLFQGQVTLPAETADTSICKSLTIETIPSPILATQGAIIIIKTSPQDWEGQFSVSTSDGSFSDTQGQTGSLINTDQKVITFSGGEVDTPITVQALGEGNENCLNTVKVSSNVVANCQELTISSYPSPLLQNESAEIIIATSPEEWSGKFLVEAESGKFKLSGADPISIGNNTKTLVTSLKKVIYTGGKSEESIKVTALDEGNENCISTLSIQ